MIKCIVCDKELEEKDYVHGGIPCFSHGAYGSKEYDPMSEDDFLEFYVCDECLVKKGDSIRRVTSITERKRLEEISFTEYKDELKRNMESLPKLTDEEAANYKLARKAMIRWWKENP